MKCWKMVKICIKCLPKYVTEYDHIGMTFIMESTPVIINIICMCSHPKKTTKHFAINYMYLTILPKLVDHVYDMYDITQYITTIEYRLRYTFCKCFGTKCNE